MVEGEWDVAAVVRRMELVPSVVDLAEEVDAGCASSARASLEAGASVVLASSVASSWDATVASEALVNASAAVHLHRDQS